MDNNTEQVIEFILEWMPYSLKEIEAMDFEKVYRLLKRAKNKQQAQINAYKKE